MVQMTLVQCSDLSPAGWLVDQGQGDDWAHLAARGPKGFPAYARLRFLPDPTYNGQSTNEVDFNEGFDEPPPIEAELIGVVLAILAPTPSRPTTVISVYGMAGQRSSQSRVRRRSKFPTATTTCSTERPTTSTTGRNAMHGWAFATPEDSERCPTRRSCGPLTAHGASQTMLIPTTQPSAQAKKR